MSDDETRKGRSGRHTDAIGEFRYVELWRLVGKDVCWPSVVFDVCCSQLRRLQEANGAANHAAVFSFGVTPHSCWVVSGCAATESSVPPSSVTGESSY